MDGCGMDGKANESVDGCCMGYKTCKILEWNTVGGNAVLNPLDNKVNNMYIGKLKVSSRGLYGSKKKENGF